jgi:hypothetical protein
MNRRETEGHLFGGSAEASGPGQDQFQRFWFSLARQPWSSLVLVPADRDGSADEVALRLAEVGKQISGSAVTAITVNSLTYDTATGLADLPYYVEQARQASEADRSVIEMPPSSLNHPDSDEEKPPGGAEPSRYGHALMRVNPVSEGRPPSMTGPRLIISIPPVVSQPLGLATAHNADLVVICVELGVSRLASTRRTLDLVGRDLVTGCFLIHPGSG